MHEELRFGMLSTIAFDDKLCPQLRALENHRLQVEAQLVQLTIRRTAAGGDTRGLLLGCSLGCPDMLMGASAGE